MRITQTLRAQHLGFMFKKHWQVQGHRIPTDTGAETDLTARGLKVVDANEFLAVKHVKTPFKAVGVLPIEIAFDETHPNWNNRICHVFGDGNVVLEGVPQAQILTKTVKVNGLPSKLKESFSKIKISPEMDKSMQESVVASHLLDAEQKKTAKIKVPERPAFVLPRVYGITDSRKNRLILAKLIHHCENLSGQTINSGRRIVNNAFFSVPFEKDGDLIQMEVHADTFITSKKSLQSFEFEGSAEEEELPNIFPIKATITLPTKNIYENKDIYPMTKASPFSNPHTILLHYSPIDVQNLHGTPITGTQFESRSLLKSFSVAVSNARSKFGDDVKKLPKPVVVQSVQTDGKSFQFGVFQLNTLELDGTDGLKNIWFSIPKMDLYSECLYKAGRPTLDGYNENVLKYMQVFYGNN